MTTTITAQDFRQDCLEAVMHARDHSTRVLTREDVVDVCVGVALGRGLVEVDSLPAEAMT